MHNSSTHSLTRLIIQQCNYHGNNLAMLLFRNNVILKKLEMLETLRLEQRNV